MCARRDGLDCDSIDAEGMHTAYVLSVAGCGSANHARGRGGDEGIMADMHSAHDPVRRAHREYEIVRGMVLRSHVEAVRLAGDVEESFAAVADLRYSAYCMDVVAASQRACRMSLAGVDGAPWRCALSRSVR